MGMRCCIVDEGYFWFLGQVLGYCCAARSDFCSSDSAVFFRCSRLAKVSGTPIRGEGSENGNKLLRRMGLVHDDDTTYNVALYFGADECVLACREMIPGLAPQRLIDSCKAFMTDLDAQSVRSENLGGGLFNIHFILSDPLDASTEITQPKPLDLTDMSVEIGKDAFGDPFRLKLKDTAGVLVGGVPGSGKSAFLNAALGSYALATDDVSMTVIDCKGGQDFSAYESRVDTFISEATDFTEVRDVLRNTVEEMNKRVKTNGAVLGESNFWNVALLNVALKV